MNNLKIDDYVCRKYDIEELYVLRDNVEKILFS